MTDSRERELIFRMAPIVARAITKRGHLAQVVAHEGLGVCSWRRCGRDCVEAQRVVIELADYLDATDGESVGGAEGVGG